MNKLPEYNILLLGESGTGKSTTINAWANYFKYENIAQALEGDFTSMISTKFILPDPNNYGQIEIISNVIDEDMDDVDEGELNQSSPFGRSETRSPFTYEFQFNDRLLRIIDTPGMGDSYGRAADIENFSKILAHLHCYKRLHGIVILFRATQTRTTAHFRYCIAELFVHLPKSACANIIFCFTFSRWCFYAPGEGFCLVKNFLDNQMKELNILLKPYKNCFFIDNEGYRYLLAKKQGYPFEDEMCDSYLESLDRTLEQSNKMFAVISELKPVDLLNVTLLDNQQKFIEEIAKLMVHLKKLISANVSEQQILKIHINKLKENKKELVNISTTEKEIVESEAILCSQTVCSSVPKCSEIILGEAYKYHRYYTTVCHDNCTCADDNVPIKIVGDESLRKCSVFNRQGNCTKCGCPWQIHLRIKERQTKRKRMECLPSILKEIDEIKSKINQITQRLKSMEKAEREYAEEFETILNIAAKFACFVIKNSLLSFNKYFESYLELQLNELSSRNERPESEPESSIFYNKLNSWKELRMVRQMCAEIMKNAEILFRKEPCGEYPMLTQILQFKTELTKLKHTGIEFEHLIHNATWKNVGIVRFRKRTLKLNRNFVRNQYKPTFGRPFNEVILFLIVVLCLQVFIYLIRIIL